MKKILCTVLALCLVFSLAACGNSKAPASGSDLPNENAAPSTGSDVSAAIPEAPTGDGMSLMEIKDSILDIDVELPTLMDIEPDEESFEYYTFVPYQEDVECLVSEAAMSSVAHSVVILRAPDSETAEALATDIQANADPRKWLCVEAEKTIVSVHNSTVLLVMSSEDAADAISANFDALWE